MPHTLKPADFTVDAGFSGIPPEDHWILLIVTLLPLLFLHVG